MRLVALPSNATPPQIPNLVLKQSLRAFFDSLSPLMVATDGVDNYLFKGSSKAQPLTLLILLNKILDSAGYTLGAVAEREVSSFSSSLKINTHRR